MSVLKNLEFDRVCKKSFFAMLVCVVTLFVCGAFRENLAVLVIGDITACVVISLYACTFAYAVCGALLKEAKSYGEFVLRSGHIFCGSCAIAQAVKLFFLLMPCPEAELAGVMVVIADTSVSWVFPMMVLKNRRAAFLASNKDKPNISAEKALNTDCI